MNLLKFINSLIIGFKTGYQYYTGSPNAAQLLQFRPHGVQEIVIVVAQGRESWRLYQLMLEYFTDVKAP